MVFGPFVSANCPNQVCHEVVKFCEGRDVQLPSPANGLRTSSVMRGKAGTENLGITHLSSFAPRTANNSPVLIGNFCVSNTDSTGVDATYFCLELRYTTDTRTFARELFLERISFPIITDHSDRL